MEVTNKDLICLFGLLSIILCVLPYTEGACDPGWYEYYDNCYYVSDSRYNHVDLEHQCSLRNASLWIWHSQDELQWMMDIVSQGPTIVYWVDLQLVNRQWTWSDGTRYDVNSIKWYQNKEGNRSATIEKCGGVYSYTPYTGQMTARNCAEGWGIICVRPKNILDLCNIADGWQFIDGVCLKFFNTTQTWFGARQTCQDNKGDLTMYSNYDQLRALDSLISCRTQDNVAWIGLSDTVQPRTFRWINNDTVRYSRWANYGYTILKNGSTCMATSPFEGYNWRNYLCDTQLKFICNRSIGVCPTGWLQNQDRCYDPNVVENSKKTWFDAKTYCESLGTRLLVINSAAEQNFINVTLNSLKVDNAWLGFSDLNQSDVLQWLDGSPATNVSLATNASSYQHWDTGFPKPVSKRFDCGLITTGRMDSLWSNAYCFNSRAFFCEMAITTVPLNPTQAPVLTGCDADWVLFRQSCYYFGPVRNQSLKNWGDASDYCLGSGGQLVIIGDPYEMAFVTVQQSKILTAWIGLSFDHTSNIFRWSDGTAPGDYWANETNFYPGEPDDYLNGQECVQIVGGRRDFSGSWDDGNCSVPQGFICEKNSMPLVGTPPPGPTVPSMISPLCGFGWIYSVEDNFCYQIVLGQPKTWQAARGYCQQNGGDLLSISGVTEQNFIQAVLSTGQYASLQLNYWIGATDQSREGGWHWTDNTPFRYLNWHTGEPNNVIRQSQPEDCAEIVPSWNYQWNDKYCIKEQVFICKKNALVTTSATLPTPTDVTIESCQGEAMISGNYSVVDSGAFSSSPPRDAQHLALNSRLLQNTMIGGGWSANVSDNNQFIVVQFYNTIIVKGIITAGRTDMDEWVSQYRIQYQESYYSEWQDYMDPPGTIGVFNGSTSANIPVTNMLMFPFEAKMVKLIPVKWHMGISLRWEIIGCVEESCLPDYAVSGPLVAKDSNLTSSTVFDIAHDAKAARLRPVTAGITPACWKPQTSDTDQWIQVDLGRVLVIRGVTIKGNPTAQEWVTQFKVKYSITDSGRAFYQEPYGTAKTITGNVDNTSPVTYYFKSHFQARYIQIIPVAWQTAIAIAFDILVCQNGCQGTSLISGVHNIPDKQMIASSVLDDRHSTARARLNLPANGAYAGAWIPLVSDTNQYLKVDLGFQVQITAVATQGAFDTQDWVTSYQLAYSNDNIKFVNYFEGGIQPRVFEGNWENRIARKHYLLLPFISQYIMIRPQAWNNRIAIRWELYGCPGAASGLRIGCFADNNLDHDLPYEPYTDPRVGMWPPMCIDHCFRKGYYYAGLQAQFKCFCGNSYGKYGLATDCSLSCFPKTSFQCGGPSSSMVYTTGLTPQFKVCPGNWKEYGNRCYILLLDTKSWYDARADCKMEGGDLASPNSQAEQDFVFSLLQYGNGQDAWIGFNDIQDESNYNWADGRQVKYTNWGLNQPSHTLNDNQDCVLMQTNTSSGGWQDELCDANHMYVCQLDKVPSSQPSVTQAISGCERGWDGYRWSCYMYGDASRTWQDSKTVCEAVGGSLVRIDDSYEQAYLASVLATRTAQYWTDVNDLALPGTYQHIVGRSDLLFTNWAPNKPDGTSQCVALGGGNVTGLWYNQPCGTKLGLVCERLRDGYTRPSLSTATTTLPPCDPGLIQTSNYCYQVNTVPSYLARTWEEALDDCVSKGGNLASFHSADDADYIWRQALVGTSGSYWIGLNDRATESGYVWTDNSAVNMLYWNDKQPDNYQGAEDCVEIWVSNSKWNDANCGERRNWICAIPRKPGSHFTTVTSLTPPTTQPAPLCSSLSGSGWVGYRSFCYLVNDGNGDNGLSWRQATKKCQQYGGDLVSIQTYEEQLLVYLVMLKNISANVVWIGLNQLDRNQGYRWSDGTALSFTNWAKNEPNDWGGEEDCVDILIRNGQWNDEHCSANLGYICKVRMGATPTPVAPTAIWAGNCPTGFQLLYNRCYRIYANAVNWTTAQSNCRALGNGYSLASILDDITNAFVTTMMADMAVNPWIGLHKNTGNQWVWINNDDNVYTNWAYGEPNGGDKEQCVQMWGDSGRAGQWNDATCGYATGYVCMTTKDSKIQTVEPVPSICDIKQGQMQYMTGCYFYKSTPMNWTAANNLCITQGGYLSSVNSAFEQAYVYLTMKQNSAAKLWIGLTDVQQPGSYSWSDGWPVLYTNWDAGQPVGSQGCVMVNSTGRWIETNCSVTLPFICKISAAVPTLTPPPPNGYCSPGWYSYGSKCYYLGVNRPRTALDASFYCQQQQATLVSIHNQTENQYLVKTMASLAHQGESFWTSLHKSLDSGFQWLDGTAVQFTNWRPGEPSTRGWAGNTENCAEVFLSDGKWNDEDCNSQRLFICEKQQAVANGVVPIGSGAPAIVPTPFPFTRPSILPPQIEPTLPQKTPIPVSQVTPGVQSNQPSQPASQQPGVTVPSSTLQVIPDNASPPTDSLPILSVKPFTGGSLPPTLAQSGVTEATSSTGLGLSPGALAGIILASLVVILLLVLIAMYWRRNTSAGQHTKFGLADKGFENEIYESEHNAGVETNHGVHLRSMSETES